MAFVHDPACIHVDGSHVCGLSPLITSCQQCDSISVGRGHFRQRVIDNLQAAKDEATAAGQTVRANVIQNMIDRVSAVT